MSLEINEDIKKKFKEIMDQNKFSEHEKTGAEIFIKNGSAQNLFHSRDRLIGFLKAYEFFHSDESNIVKRSIAEEKMLSSLREVWRSKTSEIDNKYSILVEKNETIIKDTNNKLDVLIKKNENKFNDTISLAKSMVEEWNNKLSNILQDAIEKIKANDELYKSKLRFDAAVTYWKSRANNYKKQGILWLKWLCGTCVSLIILLSAYFFCYPKCFLPEDGIGFNAATLKGTLILLTIISFGAYLIRIFSKLTFSSFHLERDAEEREQLTHVYLALKEKHKSAPEQEAIILQSLFSRVDTGMLGGDHSPTMPLGQIMDKIPGG